MEIPDPHEEPTISVERAGRLWRLGRSKAYAEARRFLETGGREGLPVIRFGRSLRVPTARLLRMLGVDPDAVVAGSDREGQPRD